MIHMQRKLKCKFVGSEEYQPEGIPRDRFLPVLGCEIRRREQDKAGKKVVVEDVYYLVTNDKGKLLSIASFNCATMIDEKAEIDLNNAVELLKNVSIIGKVISEKMAKTDTTQRSDSNG